MMDGFSVGNLNASPPLPPLLYRRIQIPNAIVRALFSTPLTIVPAQGATKAIFTEYIHLHKPAGTAFTGGGNIQIAWAGSSTSLFTAAVIGFLDQPSKRTLFSPSTTGSTYEFNLSSALNTDLQLAVTVSNPATSLDTDLFLVLSYRIWEQAIPTWL